MWRSKSGAAGTLESEQVIEWVQDRAPPRADLPATMTELHFAAVARFTAGLVRSRVTSEDVACRVLGRLPVLTFAAAAVERGTGQVVCRWRITGGWFARRPRADAGRGTLTLGVSWHPSEDTPAGGVRCRAWARVDGFPSRFLSAGARPLPPWRAVGAVYRTFHAHVVFAYLRALAARLALGRP